MSRKRIIKTTQPPKSYNTPERHFPRVTLRPTKITGNPNSRTFIKSTDKITPPINFLTSELIKNSKENICFVVGGGPSLFDIVEILGKNETLKRLKENPSKIEAFKASI